MRLCRIQRSIMTYPTYLINIHYMALEPVLTNCCKTKVFTLTSLKGHKQFSKAILNKNTKSRKDV